MSANDLERKDLMMDTRERNTESKNKQLGAH